MLSEEVLKKIICKNDVNEFHLYIINHNINLNEYGYENNETIKRKIIEKRKNNTSYEFQNIYLKNVNFDPLIFSLENDSSYTLIKFIINKYNNLNYDILNGKNPFFIALQNKNYRIADLLLDKGANIHYINCKGENVIQYLLNNKLISQGQLKYLLDRNININCQIYTHTSNNKYMKKRSLMEYLINNSNENAKSFLKIIFENLFYSNEFIIKLITILKHQKSLSKESLNFIINNEKKKFIITKEIYKSIIALGDPVILNNLFLYDTNFELESKRKNITDENTGYKLLSNSISMSNLEIIKLLNKKGFSVNEIGDNGMTPLIQAIYFNKMDYIQFLLNQGADVNKKSIKDEFPILCAVKKRSVDILEKLYEYKVDVNQQDSKGNTTLMYACQFGYLNVVESLINHDANINAQNKEGITALMIALRSNRKSIIEYLLDQKHINVNIKCKRGFNAVMYAAKDCSSENFELFLNKSSIKKMNINLNETDNEGYNALIHACFYGGRQIYVYNSLPYLCRRIFTYNNIIQDLLHKCINFKQHSINNETALSIAASYGSLKIVELLIDKGMDIHAVNRDKRSVLMLACRNHLLTLYKKLENERSNVNTDSLKKLNKILFNIDDELYQYHYQYNNREGKYGYIHLIKFLVEKGVNIHDIDSKGNNALMIAANHGFLNIVEYLVDNKISINEKNNDGHTALMMASINGYVDVAEYLIEHGADKTITDNNGNNAFLLAAQEGNLEIIRYLESVGMNIHEKNNDNKNALLIAIEHNHQAIAQYLNEHGVDPNDVDKNGWNALITASYYSRLPMVQYFYDAGVDVNKVDNDGWTALMHCVFVYGDKKYPFRSYLDDISRLMNDSYETIKYLINHSAKINIKEHNGKTALALASQFGPLRNVKYLIDMGADISITDNKGNSILSFAHNSVFFDNYLKLMKENTGKHLLNSKYTSIIEATCAPESIENFYACQHTENFKSSNYILLLDYLNKVKKVKGLILLQQHEE